MSHIFNWIKQREYKIISKKRLTLLRKRLIVVEDAGHDKTIDPIKHEIRTIQRRYNRKINRIVN